MKIPNPFYNFMHVRFRCQPGDLVGVVGRCDELDVPDNCEACLIEAIDRGHSQAKTVFTSRMWDKDRGIVGVEDYIKLREIEAEREKMVADREKEAERKAKAARERAVTKKAKTKEKPAKPVIAEKPAPVITERMEDISSGIKKGIIDPDADMGKELKL